MHKVRGTEGYAEVVEEFIKVTKSISFTELHRPFIQFLPVAPANVLDVGSGIGRDASILSEMGYYVIAVEPTEEFLIEAKKLYGVSNIQWINDSLPHLKLLGEQPNQFDFVLASGVWHHLDELEQKLAMLRIAYLLRPSGVFVMSLRHGRAGAGVNVFPTCGQRTVEEAKEAGLTSLLYLPHQPSLILGKDQVTWTRLAFTK